MNKVEIPSNLADGVEVVENILAETKAKGFDDAILFAIRLALDEAMANAIRHGNNSDASKQVTVEYQVTTQDIRVTICDEGLGFKPEDIPDPTLDENLERPCGRGVMLMKAYMGTVTYNDRGNCVTMVKSVDRSDERSEAS